MTGHKDNTFTAGAFTPDGKSDFPTVFHKLYVVAVQVVAGGTLMCTTTVCGMKLENLRGEIT